MNPLQAQFPNTVRQYWTGLHGSAQSLAILNAARHHDGITLLLTRSGHQANVLEQDLKLLADGEIPVLHFPDWETLPYDLYSPHPDIISRRLATLAELPTLQQGILLLPVSTLLQRVSPTEFVLGRSISLHQGQSLNLESFRETLIKSGYESADQVIRPGQFAVRGGLLDIFPMGADQAHRVELFDDEIDTIRSFDTDSQRSLQTVAAIRLLPAREYPFHDQAITGFKRAFRLQFDVDTRHCPLYQDLREGLHPQGLEYYLPLFFSHTATLLDYLKQPPLLVAQSGVRQAAQDFWQQLSERHEQRRHDIERPILPPQMLYLEIHELNQQLQSLNSVHLSQQERDEHGIEFSTQPPPDLHIHEKSAQPAAALHTYLQQTVNKVLLVADSPGRREVLTDSLHALDIKPEIISGWAEFRSRPDKHLALTVLPLDTGFTIPGQPGITVLTEAQLFGGRIRRKQPGAARERDPETLIRNLSDLHIGAPVVHEDHGVGRYRGLQVLTIDEQPQEFLTLEYAGEDKLYVPVASLQLISRYTGSSPESAPLHRLGGDQWEKLKQRAAKQARDTAAELLDLYARREARKGFNYTLDRQLYTDFAATFAYEETMDQQTAIQAVVDDLTSGKAMDRVICGDVGFGKTEVALRAAFVAAQAGRQVALLVPTTLLAQQHYNQFTDRFADWPVRVELLSRFSGGKKTQAIVDALAEGTVDIVIGTHRLIQGDVRFKQLGLVIIDEEQRFGVRQKERLKALRTEVDVLTLTATPIPRTLNMALSGLRDLSIIATPPARRMAVKTFTCQWDNGLIREAMQRELQRGGQVYFLHNEVRSIEKTAREVQALMPAARVRIAHGQMQGRELESVMRDFYRQRFNVLVCTTIIESGIDIPSANTIIINRADKFGLAQLHQLRGRVGRSHHRAYAYLLTPHPKSMTRDARKRLEAIASLEELGAGFTLATHDLEIRGAGELLGDEQSGQIQAIGFSLYMDLLNRAVAALKSGREPELEQPVSRNQEVNLNLPALIPEDYLPDVHTRLILYKRIASAADQQQLRELQVEMIDRFGLLPEQVKNLFAAARLKLTAQALGITKAVAHDQGGYLEFSENARIDPAALIRLIQTRPEQYTLQGPEKLKFTQPQSSAAERITSLERTFQALAPKAAENSVRH